MPASGINEQNWRTQIASDAWKRMADLHGGAGESVLSRSISEQTLLGSNHQPHSPTMDSTPTARSKLASSSRQHTPINYQRSPASFNDTPLASAGAAPQFPADKDSRNATIRSDLSADTLPFSPRGDWSAFHMQVPPSPTPTAETAPSSPKAYIRLSERNKFNTVPSSSSPKRDNRRGSLPFGDQFGQIKMGESVNGADHQINSQATQQQYTFPIRPRPNLTSHVSESMLLKPTQTSFYTSSPSLLTATPELSYKSSPLSDQLPKLDVDADAFEKSVLMSRDNSSGYISENEHLFAANGEEICTIFVVGFPDDMCEREFINMFTFARGFEAAILKIPRHLLAARQGEALPNGHSPYSSHQIDASPSDRKQIIGFAKFRTTADAIAAREMLTGRRIDFDRGYLLKAELAKRNLRIRANDMTGLAQSSSTTSSMPSPANEMVPLPAFDPTRRRSEMLSIDTASTPALSSASFPSSDKDDFENVLKLSPRTRSSAIASSFGKTLLQQLDDNSDDILATANIFDCTESAYGDELLDSLRMRNPLALNLGMKQNGIGVSDPSDEIVVLGDPASPTSSCSGTQFGVVPSIYPHPHPVHRIHNPADSNPPINTLYIGGLPSILPNAAGTMSAAYLEDALRSLFNRCDGFKRLSFRTKNQNIMAFCEFDDVLHATKALHELYGSTLGGLVKGGIRLAYSKNPLGVRTAENPSNSPPFTLSNLPSTFFSAMPSPNKRPTSLISESTLYSSLNAIGSRNSMPAVLDTATNILRTSYATGFGSGNVNERK